MKKFFLIIVAAAVGLLSCEKEDCKTQTIEQECYEELKSDLVLLNSTLVAESDVTKGGIGWIGWANVAVTDALMYLSSGNVGLSGLMSLKTWIVEKVKQKRLATKSTCGSDDSSGINCQEIALSFVSGDGEIHNRVIIALYEKYGEQLVDMADDELEKLFSEEYAKVMGINISKCKVSNKDKVKIDEMLDAYNKSDNLDDFVNRLNVSSDEEKQLVEIMGIVMGGYEKIDAVSDNGKYEKDVNNVIAKSNIPKKSKQVLSNAISVANASSRLWN